MLKAALFDMDGLMFDTERLSEKAWLEAAPLFNITITPRVLSRVRGTNAQSVRNTCLEIYGEAFDFDAFYKKTWEIMQRTLSVTVPHREGLVPLLEYLKGRRIKMAVASSTKQEHVIQNLKTAKVFDYFDVVIGGDMVKISKPAPDIYLAAANALGVQPCECVALEDSFNGIRSASAAGCICIMVPDIDEPGDEIRALCAKVSQSLFHTIEFIETIK